MQTSVMFEVRKSASHKFVSRKVAKSKMEKLTGAIKALSHILLILLGTQVSSKMFGVVRFFVFVCFLRDLGKRNLLGPVGKTFCT